MTHCGFIDIIEGNSNKYIGSTSNPLEQRLQEHIRSFACNISGLSDKKTTAHKCLNETREFTIRLLECVWYSYNSELLLRERFHIENTPDCVNANIPIRTDDEMKEYKKQYYLNNKQKYQQRDIDNAESIRKRKTAIVICECGASHTRNSLSRHVKSNKHLEAMKLKTENETEN